MGQQDKEYHVKRVRNWAFESDGYHDASFLRIDAEGDIQWEEHKSHSARFTDKKLAVLWAFTLKMQTPENEYGDEREYSYHYGLE